MNADDMGFLPIEIEDVEKSWAAKFDTSRRFQGLGDREAAEMATLERMPIDKDNLQ